MVFNYAGGKFRLAVRSLENRSRVSNVTHAAIFVALQRRAALHAGCLHAKDRWATQHSPMHSPPRRGRRR